MWHITLTIHFRCDVLYIDLLFEELTCYSVHNLVRNQSCQFNLAKKSLNKIAKIMCILYKYEAQNKPSYRPQIIERLWIISNKLI